VQGALWASTAAVFHSLVPVAVRMLSDTMPSIEIVFLRNLIGLVALLVYFVWRGFGSLRTERIMVHAQRNLLNFAGMWFWFAGVALLPLGQAVALHFTVPLMAVPLAMLFLRERPGRRRWAATLIGFAGVLVILRPGFNDVGPAAFLVLGSAASYASVGIYTRVLVRTDSPLVTTFYYLLMLTAFAAVPAIWVWVPPTWEDVPAVILLALVGTVAPYCLIRAYHYAEASFLSAFDFLRLPFTVTAAYLFFGEVSDHWTWVGAAIIFTSTSLIARHESRAESERKMR
jgi:drug/metabolite transporter (DMT)-like permease